jgi:hypothetical protein
LIVDAEWGVPGITKRDNNRVGGKVQVTGIAFAPNRWPSAQQQTTGALKSQFHPAANSFPTANLIWFNC